MASSILAATRRFAPNSAPCGVRRLVLACSLGILQQLHAGEADHPRLYVTRAGLQALRAKAVSVAPTPWDFTTREAWERIQARADGFVKGPAYAHSVEITAKGTRDIRQAWKYTLSDADPPRHDDTPHYPPWTAMFQESDDSITTRVLHLSLAYLVTSDEAYVREARKIVGHLLRWQQWTDPSYSRGQLAASLDTGHCTAAVAIFYDWCYDALTDAERRQIRAALLSKGIQPCLRGIDHYSPEMNVYAVIASGATIGAVALAPEEPEAERLVPTCLAHIQKSLDRCGADGGPFEGPGYGTYLLDSLLRGIEVLDSAGVKHNLAAHRTLATLDRYCIGLLAPDVKQLPNFADGLPEPACPQTMSWLAHRGNPAAAWYLQQIGALQITTVYDFLRFDAARLDPRPPEWNPSVAFVDVGYASLRDGFNAASPSLLFKCGPPTQEVGHNHFDQNAFVLSCGGEWLVPNRGYRNRHDARKTKFTRGTIGHSTLVLDIDDAYLRRTESPDPGHDQVKKSGGRIVEFFAGTAFDLVRGSAAEAYNSPERSVLTKFDRTILFIKPHGYIVRDEIEAPAPHRLSLLFQTGGDGRFEPLESGAFLLRRRRAEMQIWSAADRPLTPHVAPYPGAEEFGPQLRWETDATRRAVWTSVLLPRAGGSNLIANGGFETGLTGWKPRAGADLPHHTVVEDDPAEGEQCARIETSGFLYSPRIVAAPGTTLTARVRLRTAGVPAGQGAVVAFHFRNDKGKAVSSARSEKTVSEAWTEQTLTARVPPGTASTTLGLEFFAPGAAWFDDVRVETGGPQAAAPPVAWRPQPHGGTLSVGDAGPTTHVVFGPTKNAQAELETDAAWAVATLDGDGVPLRLFWHHGTYIRRDGEILLQLDAPTTGEFLRDGDTLRGTISPTAAPHAPLAKSLRATLSGPVKQATVNGRRANVSREGDGVAVELR